MKPKQIKLIKSLYKSADYERKEKIKECFPEVFGLPSEGWVKHKDGAFIYITGKDTGYGFDRGGNWIESPTYISFTFESAPQYWRPANEKEVKEMLIAEAKIRGVWDCPMVNPFGTISETDYGREYIEFMFEKNQLWSQYGIVFDNGKWATKLEKPKTETIQLFGNMYKITLID